jgi:peroxiredoxin
MVLTPSTMPILGTSAPNFSLTDVVTENLITLDTFKEKKGLLVMFICRHCPFVVHVQEELSKIGLDYQTKNLGILAISSNDAIAHPDDSPQNLAAMAKELNFSFPYCFDESQDVAKAFNAACTPDFFLFNQERNLVYRGQLDDSRPDNGKPVTGNDLRIALNALLNNEAISAHQTPSIGCNIKWKEQ